MAKGKQIQKEVWAKLVESDWKATEASKQDTKTGILNLIRTTLGNDVQGWALVTITLMEETAKKCIS